MCEVRGLYGVLVSSFTFYYPYQTSLVNYLLPNYKHTPCSNCSGLWVPHFSIKNESARNLSITLTLPSKKIHALHVRFLLFLIKEEVYEYNCYKLLFLLK